MGTPKRKAVVNAEESQLERVRIEHDRIAEAVERYVAAGHADEDSNLIGARAFDRKRRRG
jgi:hypothetical protein